MDISRLSRGGQIVAIAGLLYFVDSFLMWHRACITNTGGSICISTGSAWQSAPSLLATLLIIALVAEVLAVEAAGFSLPPLGALTWEQVRVGAAGAAVLLVLCSLVFGRSAVTGFGTISSHPAFGVIAGLVLAIVVVAGECVRSAATLSDDDAYDRGAEADADPDAGAQLP